MSEITKEQVLEHFKNMAWQLKHDPIEFCDKCQAIRALIESGVPAVEYKLRPEVAAFARLMEDRLQANEQKGGWKGCSVSWLFDRLMGEANELSHELEARAYMWVDKEAADVANFAMMIVDVCGRLKSGVPAPSPSPLPKEVDEAMERIQRALHHADHYRNVYQNFGEEDQLIEFRRDKAALAVIRAALEPKRVTREWVETLVEVARWGDKDGGYARVKSRLCSELGVGVEEKP